MESFLTYLGLALGALGLIASYYFYKRSIRIKEVFYSIRSNNLISSSVSTLENLKISYKKEKSIKNLTVSKILFYNRGAETVTKQDIDTLNHLRIIAKNDVKILDASILQSNNSSSQVQVILDNVENHALVNFEYLNENQGAVIQVVHAGLSSEDIQIVGDIKGVQKLVTIQPERLRTRSDGKKAIRSLILTLGLIAVILALTFGALVLINKLITGGSVIHLGFDNILNGLNTLIAMAFIGITLGMGSSIANETLDTGAILVRAVLPEGLEKFLE